MNKTNQPANEPQDESEMIKDTLEASVNTESSNQESSSADLEGKSSEIEDLNQQITQLKNQLLYKAAEFDNYRKRVIKEKADQILNGGEKTISAILPIIDDLERAQANMDKMEDLQAVKQGIDLIIVKFFEILKKEGLQKIASTGEEFNTDYHEAVAMIPAASQEQANKIVDCIEQGYMLNDKVIRCSKVVVATKQD